MFFSTSRIPVWPGLVFALVAAGCSDSGDDDSSSGEVARYQIINAIPDSPTLAVSIEEVIEDEDEDDSEETSALIYLLGFQSATSTMQTVEYAIEIEVTYEDPDSDADLDLIETFTLNVSDDVVHYILLTGKFDTPSVQVITRDYGDLEDIEEDEITEVQVINASALDPAIVTITGDTVQSFTLSPGNASPVERINSDVDYSLLLTDAADETLFVVDEISLPEATRSLVLVTDSLEGGYEPIVLSTFGATTSFVDDALPSFLRVVNAIPDADPVSIELIDSFGLEEVASFSLGFLEMAGPFEVDADVSFLDLIATSNGDVFESVVSVNSVSQDLLVIGGALVEASTAATLERISTVAPATTVSLFVVNTADLTVLDDDDEEVPLEVSVYVLEPGERLGASNAEASSLGHMDAQRLSVAATPSVIVATRSGTSDIVAGPLAVEMTDGSSVVVLVSEAAGGGGPLQLSVLSVE